LKDEAERLGIDLKAAVEELLAERKAKAPQVARELGELMNVKPDEWVNDVKTARYQM